MIKQLIVAASAALLCAGAQAATYKDGTYTCLLYTSDAADEL